MKIADSKVQPGTNRDAKTGEQTVENTMCGKCMSHSTFNVEQEYIQNYDKKNKPKNCVIDILY